MIVKQTKKPLEIQIFKRILIVLVLALVACAKIEMSSNLLHAISSDRCNDYEKTIEK